MTSVCFFTYKADMLPLPSVIPFPQIEREQSEEGGGVFKNLVSAHGMKKKLHVAVPQDHLIS